MSDLELTVLVELGSYIWLGYIAIETYSGFKYKQQKSHVWWSKI